MDRHLLREILSIMSNSVNQSSPRYLHALVVLLMLIGICLLFPETTETYIDKWNKFDESLGHGYLIFVIVIFELFKSNYSSITQQKYYHTLMLFIIMLTIFHEISKFWGILIFQQFSMYFIWLACIAYVTDFKYLKKIYFPLAFFLFAVPFWEFSNTFFVELTTQAVTFFLNFTDLTVYIHENHIETPYGVILVAEGCSGIRYFEIGFALSVYAVHGECISKRYKMLVILTGIALGIITNWIRVIGLIYVGYYSKMTSSLMTEHETYGFILFFIVITGVIFLLNYIRARHSLPDKANIEHSSEGSNKDSNILTIVFKLSIALLCIFITKTLLIQQLNKVDQNAVKYQVEKETFPLLNNLGKFDEAQSDILFQDKSCKLVTRKYYFVTPGENVIPYSTLINQEKVKISSRSLLSIDYLQQSVEANKLDLFNLYNNRDVSTFYYWYEYSDIKTANKYIAKLLEISYLLGSEEKMVLKLVWCPSTN